MSQQPGIAAGPTVVAWHRAVPQPPPGYPAPAAGRRPCPTPLPGPRIPQPRPDRTPAPLPAGPAAQGGYGGGGPVAVRWVGTPVPVTNTKAILALVLSVLGLCGIGSLAGITLGRQASTEIELGGERGAGIARAAIVTGWVTLGITAFLVVLSVLLVAAAIGSVP